MIELVLRGRMNEKRWCFIYSDLKCTAMLWQPAWTVRKSGHEYKLIQKDKSLDAFIYFDEIRKET